jgi:hypothetical protein
MKILIVSATKHEVEPLIERMESVEVNGRLLSGRFKQSEIVIVITGVGMVATAYYTGSVWMIRMMLLLTWESAEASTQILRSGMW